MPVTAFDGNGLVSKLEILRGDLVDVLYQATKDTVEYRFNTRISELKQDDDGVDVTLAGGTATASGFRRRRRRPAFRGARHGVRARGAVRQAPRRLQRMVHRTRQRRPGRLVSASYLAPGGLNASMRPTHDPATAKAGLAFQSEPDHLRPPRPRRTAPDSGGQVRGRRLAVRRFAHRGAGGDDFYFDSFAQVHMPAWSTGRVTLVGDAGYCASPLSGMGTSLALVGAYVLAGELGPADSLDASVFKPRSALPDEDASVRSQMPGPPQPRRPLRAQVGVGHHRQYRGDEVDAALAVPADRGQAVVHRSGFDPAADETA